MKRLGAIGAALALGLLATQAAATAAPKLEDHYADDNGVKIHYVAAGEGPLVVMIHGFPDYWGTWKPMIRTLSADHYRTAAVDLRGYNLSDKPQGVASYAMPLLISDIAAVIKAEGRTKAIVIGHDWGAAIAWQVVINRPDLVDKLVIMSVPHPTTFAHEMATDPVQQKNSQYARNFQKEGAEKALTAEGLAGWVKDPKEKPLYVEAVIKAEHRSSAIIIGHDWGAAISWQLAMTRPDLVNKLIIMSVPHPAGFAREMATDKAQQAGSQYARNFQQPGFEKNLSPEMLAGMHGKDPAEHAAYLAAFQRSNIGDMLNYYRANYPKTTDGTGTMGAPVTPITVPVLVIHGMKDTALNAAGHNGTWDHVTADTTILMIPTAGHWVQHDAQDLVDRTVKDWLAQRR